MMDPAIQTEILRQMAPEGQLQIQRVEDGAAVEGVSTTGNEVIIMHVHEVPKPSCDASTQTAVGEEYLVIEATIPVAEPEPRKGFADSEVQTEVEVSSNNNSIVTNNIHEAVHQQHKQVTDLLPNLFTCHICGRVYKSKLNWQRHLKTHAGEQLCMCGVCGRVFTKRSNLDSHMKSHNPDKSYVINIAGSQEGKPVEGLSLNTLDLGVIDVSMQTEISTQAEQNNLEQELQNETMKSEAEVTTKYIYACNICGRQYNNKSNCQRHLRQHTDPKPHTCDVCQKRFGQKYELRQHARIHTGEKPYKCEICNRGFNEPGNLRRHMRTHARRCDSRFKCGVCCKGFDDAIKLQVHLKTHSVDRIYKCDLCQRVFKKIGDLYRHIRIHTGEKPHTCEFCDKKFAQKVNLVAHRRSHTGEKPYTCNICKMGFSRKKILDKHVELHSETGKAVPDPVEEEEEGDRIEKPIIIRKKSPKKKQKKVQHAEQEQVEQEHVEIENDAITAIIPQEAPNDKDGKTSKQTSAKGKHKKNQNSEITKEANPAEQVEHIEQVELVKVEVKESELGDGPMPQEGTEQIIMIVKGDHNEYVVETNEPVEGENMETDNIQYVVIKEFNTEDAEMVEEMEAAEGAQKKIEEPAKEDEDDGSVTVEQILLKLASGT